MDCKYCGKELPRSLESGGFHPGCLRLEEKGIGATIQNVDGGKATDINLEYEASAISFIKFISIFTWIGVGIFFLIFLISLTGGIETNPFIIFIVLLVLILNAVSLSFIFQIFFYLKGVYEELKKLNKR
jgi:hypothetical protein